MCNSDIGTLVTAAMFLAGSQDVDRRMREFSTLFLHSVITDDGSLVQLDMGTVMEMMVGTCTVHEYSDGEDGWYMYCT